MKRLLPFVLLLCIGGMLNADTFRITAAASWLQPADKNFRDFYGSGEIFPEVQVALSINKALFIQAGYGFFTDKATTEILKNETKSRQGYLSVGAGVNVPLAANTNLRFSAGALFCNYKETDPTDELKENAVGFRVDGVLSFRLGGHLAIEPMVGYMNAKDTVEEIDVKLGGIKAGIGLSLFL